MSALWVTERDRRVVRLIEQIRETQERRDALWQQLAALEQEIVDLSRQLLDEVEGARGE